MQLESTRSFNRGTTGFSDPEQLNQRKSKRLIERLVASTPNMGVSLRHVVRQELSPLCLVPVFLTGVSLPDENTR